MNSELIIDVSSKDISIALLEDKRLVELSTEQRDVKFSVGDIHLGKVKKIMPGLNAAFVDVGYEKDAFLHYLDLGPQFSSLKKFIALQSGPKKGPSLQKFRNEQDIDKNGSIGSVMKNGMEIVVQIAKEPISTKGPRLTSELSIAGRYMVLMPFSNRISVSQKINSVEEKSRLKKLVQSIKPNNFGVIIRTVAEGIKVADLDKELKTLVKRWEETVEVLTKAKSPQCIYEEVGRTSAILRDILNPEFSNIYINDKAVYNEVRDFVSIISSGQEKIVKLYKGDAPIFDQFGVTKQIKSSFGKTVSFKNGAYLIIEHTEALHVIDVNSGNRSRSGQNQETNALEVNLAAADEIARQLRLRDMGGIIVVDFIDMHGSEHKQKVFERIKTAMAQDRTKHQILPLSKFGLLQITRQRVRPEMHKETDETCPSCFGKGEIRPSILFVDQLEGKIDYLVNTLKVKEFQLEVHPYVYAYITKGFFSVLRNWRKKYTSRIKIKSIESFAFLQYKFYDKNMEDIDLKEEMD
ncbi:ribonuclease E/G [Saccharicrinis sp. FJH54]|uniref:Rne/Rng family ribonuclease n=1 Tax=Saccharicrinis sp. FJH54 TaxID=3344665 RepID=UPI0035D3E211